MAPDDLLDLDRWVNDRLAAVAPADLAQRHPAARLTEILSRRAARRARRGRWAAVALVAAVMVMTVPGARAFGARCVEACVSATSRAASFWRHDEPLAS